MPNRRILFVDDEISVLEGLENILRRQRHVWSMTFAAGGKAALDALSRESFDVIVSDMKMPGMDGPALLQLVQERYPHVARIVLSGQADREAVLRAVPVTHQFLSKPCDADVLRAVIDRTCTLQDLLTDEAICRVVGKLTRLPSAPQSYWRLNQALSRDNVSPAELAGIVEEDPAMTAKVLQLVNSAYFGLAQAVTSIQQAVLYLGVELLRGLLVTARAFALMDGRARDAHFSVGHLQAHSLLTARVARRLAGDSPLRDEAFTVGILHDIGQIVLAVGRPDVFRECHELSRVARRPLHELEREAFGVSHAEVGAYLLGVWGLPFSMVETVAFHHRPSLAPGPASELLAILHAADGIVAHSSIQEAKELTGVLDMAFLASGSWTAKLAAWQQSGRDELTIAGDQLGEPLPLSTSRL